MFPSDRVGSRLECSSGDIGLSKTICPTRFDKIVVGYYIGKSVLILDVAPCSEQAPADCFTPTTGWP